jgi:hypothetical protein
VKRLKPSLLQMLDRATQNTNSFGSTSSSRHFREQPGDFILYKLHYRLLSSAQDLF